MSEASQFKQFCTVQPTSKEPTERKHLVESAGHYFNSARRKHHGTSGGYSGAVFDIQQAYNHVENALAAALRHLHAISEAPSESHRAEALERAEKFLEGFPNFKP